MGSCPEVKGVHVLSVLGIFWGMFWDVLGIV